MRPTRAEVLEWVEGRLGRTLTLAEQADVLATSGRDGSDALSLIQGFGARFGVNLGSYRPAMHHAGDADLWHPDWPIPAPPLHGVRVPISVSILHSAAVAGTWPVIYPTLPQVRSLTWANVPLLICGLPAATLGLLWAIRQVF